MLINKTTGAIYDEFLSKSYGINNVGTKPIENSFEEYNALYEEAYRDADPLLDNMNCYLSIEEAYERMNAVPSKVKIKLLKR